MTGRAKDLAMFAGLFAVSVSLAVGGMVWLGPDGRVPVDMTADGEVTRSVSVVVLWFGPGLMLAMLALGAPGSAWLSTALAQARADEGREDAARGLARYLGAFRIYGAAFLVLTIGLQVFLLARAGGVARPLGLDRDGFVRLFFVLAGLLFVFIGNVAPKIPYVASRWIDAARHHKANRFFGLVFALGGAGYCVAAVVTPFNRLSAVMGVLGVAMILLPLARIAWLTIDYRRTLKSRGCEPG
jgi:hypothetical protein